MNAVSPAVRRFLAVLLVLLPVVVAYRQVGGHAFVNWDDQAYVYENRQVQRGLSPDGIAWAFTAVEVSNWHPLTWLSHMADVSLFGLDAGWHHRVNVLFHMADTALLFLLLQSMTGSLWRSALAAALFGAHPLHVESVAWVSERKDVLSTMFWLLATASWVRYARRPGAWRYAAVVLFFGLGLLCKPMLVTLPFTLLLLDCWPLGRLAPARGAAGSPGRLSGRRFLRLVAEKAPLLAMSAASSIVTYAAQAGAMATWERAAPWSRLSNAIVSFAAYLGKTAWPASLAAIYPYPAAGIPAWRVAAALLLLGGITFAALRCLPRRPWLPTGWFWYLGTLFPVIGLVQVGPQAMADRYTYVPLIGIFLLIAWEGAERSARLRVPRAVPGLAAAALVALLASSSRVQAGYWKDSVTLFRRALEVTENNYLAHNNLGGGLAVRGELDEAERHLREANRIAPTFAEARNSLGIVLATRGKADEAIASYREALRLDPKLFQARNNLANVLADRGDLEEAVLQYREALRLRPGEAAVLNNLGVALGDLGRLEESIAAYREALRLDPGLADAGLNLRDALARGGRRDADPGIPGGPR